MNEAGQTSRLLAIDTSTTSMTTAIIQGDKLIAESKAIAERNHSIYLVPSIIELLATASLEMKDIQGIGVGQGPGSYTGVRIGVSVAKTIAWTLNVPLIGVSSLEAMAMGAADTVKSSGARWVVPMMDARRGQVYTGLYEIREGRTHLLLPDGNRLLSDWLDELAERSQARGGDDKDRCAAEIALIGETTPFEDQLKAPRAWSTDRVHIRETSIRAYDIGRLARFRLLRGEIEDVHEFVPNYTQLAEAEAKYLARQQRQEPTS